MESEFFQKGVKKVVREFLYKTRWPSRMIKKKKTVKSLSGREEFSEVFQKGIYFPYEFGYMKVLPFIASDSESGAHLGVVARKKIGTAVERNRAKRIIREALREILKNKCECLRGSFAIIFVLNEVKLDFKVTKASIENALNKCSLFMNGIE